MSGVWAAWELHAGERLSFSSLSFFFPLLELSTRAAEGGFLFLSSSVSGRLPASGAGPLRAPLRSDPPQAAVCVPHPPRP